MLFKLAWKHFRSHKIALVAVLLLQTAQALISLSLPTLNADIINHGVMESNIAYVWKVGALMLGLTALQAVCIAFAFYNASKLSMRMGYKLRRQVFSKVADFSPGQLRDFGVGTLITRATNDIQQIQIVIFMCLTMMVVTPIMGFGGIAMAIHQDAKLSLLLAVAVPALIIVFFFITRLAMPLFKRYQKLLDQTNAQIRSQLSGVRVIRAFNRQDLEQQRFGAQSDQLYATAMKFGLYFSLLMPYASLVIGISWAAIIWFGGMRIDSGGMQVGSLIAFINYLMQIMISVMITAMIFTMFPRGAVAASRVQDVLQTPLTIVSPDNPKPFPGGALHWDINDVSVTFGDAEEPVLEHLNLHLAPGKTVAIVGATGCGKSTAAQLLLRLLDPSSGTVTVRGEGQALDLRELDLSELRNHLAFVPQTAHLFRGSLASNIASKPDSEISNSERELIWQALEIANADEFIKQREGQLETEVDTGGVGFSGGQRQRLTIARAVYRLLTGQAQTLIIDDSFSALDLATDVLVRSRLKSTFPQVATLIVAQRLATIRQADEILVISDGTVVGRGRHEELMESCEIYRQIADSQAQVNETEGAVTDASITTSADAPTAADVTASRERSR